jgi:hypothetical protein
MLMIKSITPRRYGQISLFVRVTLYTKLIANTKLVSTMATMYAPTVPFSDNGGSGIRSTIIPRNPEEYWF